ncbi:MAG: 50S ribosomal protein L15 [Dehalococcoidia bacterium]|nr:50S ribosomal protein L15 [Dehalococcoidia bacterium]
MDQHTIRQAKGAKHARKRVGRGPGSGTGTYAGRGRKGQKARGSVRPGFEGGQIPMVRRLPRLRGFKNALRVEFQAVNLADLVDRFPAGSVVDADALAAVRLISDANEPFKVLARGELAHALTVRAPRLSEAAKQAITAAGGSFEELAPAEKRVRNRVHRRKAQEAAAPAAAPAAEPAQD